MKMIGPANNKHGVVGVVFRNGTHHLSLYKDHYKIGEPIYDNLVGTHTRIVDIVDHGPSIWQVHFLIERGEFKIYDPNSDKAIDYFSLCESSLWEAIDRIQRNCIQRDSLGRWVGRFAPIARGGSRYWFPVD